MARLSLSALAAITAIGFAGPASAASSSTRKIYSMEVYGTGYNVRLSGSDGMFYSGIYGCPHSPSQVYDALMRAHMNARRVRIVYNNNGSGNRKCIMRAVIM